MRWARFDILFILVSEYRHLASASFNKPMTYDIERQRNKKVAYRSNDQTHGQHTSTR
eukprot:m.199579 g.199579  ORF g.199579 m.199579 type:complete len:57 (+) comp17043_c0_seq68:2698-2868(+)